MKMIKLLTHLSGKNIFLFDAVGASLSLVLTGGVLPVLSPMIGISKSVLYVLALFPFTYGLYSSICYKLQTRKPWMLLALVLANSFYGILSISLMLTCVGITLWGYLFLSAEILVLLGVIMVEWSVYRREPR